MTIIQSEIWSYCSLYRAIVLSVSVLRAEHSILWIITVTIVIYYYNKLVQFLFQFNDGFIWGRLFNKLAISRQWNEITNLCIIVFSKTPNLYKWHSLNILKSLTEIIHSTYPWLTNLPSFYFFHVTNVMFEKPKTIWKVRHPHTPKS